MNQKVADHNIKVETVLEREDFGNGQSRLSVRVLVEGQDCGTVTVLSVNAPDVDDFLKGEVSWEDLRARLHRRTRW